MSKNQLGAGGERGVSKPDMVIPVRVELNGQGKLSTSIGKATRMSRALYNNGSNSATPQGSTNLETPSTVLPQIHNSVVVVADSGHSFENSGAGRSS